MTWFPDLSPYSYSGRPLAWLELPVLNVGWLGREGPFVAGETSPLFRERLAMFCRPAYLIRLTRGLHMCEVCWPSERYWPDWRVLPPDNPLWQGCGNGEVWVMGRGVVYAAPALIGHYVDAHDYCPPAAFIEAVLESDGPEGPFYATLREEEAAPAS